MATNWETADIIDIDSTIAWQFDYGADAGPQIEKLKKLYGKSKRMQWNAETDVDWSANIDGSAPLIDEERFGFAELPLMKKLSASQRERFRAHMTAQLLSQILHGEQGALMTSAVLTHRVPDYEGKLYAAQQTVDEARHVEAFQLYIERLAIIYPMGEGLKKLIDVTLSADHWVKVAIGMNMVVEGLALGTFHNFRNATQCATLRRVLELVLRDESRHVAFGNVYVSETMRDMHPDDREDVAEFAFEAISMNRGNNRRRAPDPGFVAVLQNADIDPGDFFREALALREERRAQGRKARDVPGEVHSFRHLMMPALVRVGAVTERIRPRYEEAGIRIFEDTAILESMEDGDTGDIDFAVA